LAKALTGRLTAIELQGGEADEQTDATFWATGYCLRLHAQPVQGCFSW
jgi:hypothetical protein